jgi:hypothetical protein
MPGRNDKIDRATAALRADKAACPFRDRESGAIANRLFAGIDVDAVLTALAPGPQQQIRLGRSAERYRARRAFEALTLHCAVVSSMTRGQRQ